MRKVFLILAILLPICANAQFKLTINGFVNSNDESKDYVVYNYEGKTQESLYIEVLKFINTSYKSPKDVINEVKPEMITISGFQPDRIGVGKVFGKTYASVYDLQYNISIRFKDGRIRIDSPSFECTKESGGRTSRLVMSGSNGGFGTEVKTGLFKKNGKPSRESAIKQIEDFFNEFCSSLQKSVNDSSDEDW